MTEEKLDDQESLEPGGEEQPNAELESNEELTKAKEVAENQKIRAEKAEAKLKKIAEASEEKTETETPKKEKQPDESDDTREMVEDTFMESKGLNLDAQKEYARKEAQETGKPLKDVLNMKYVQEELKNISDQSEAEAGMPEGKGKGSGGTKDSVEYWVNKTNADGTYATPPDMELANKVIDARVAQQGSDNKFSDDLY